MMKKRRTRTKRRKARVGKALGYKPDQVRDAQMDEQFGVSVLRLRRVEI